MHHHNILQIKKRLFIFMFLVCISKYLPMPLNNGWSVWTLGLLAGTFVDSKLSVLSAFPISPSSSASYLLFESISQSETNWELIIKLSFPYASGVVLFIILSFLDISTVSVFSNLSVYCTWKNILFGNIQVCLHETVL